MLHDCCDLLPELYGDTRCTHNAHLLTHLAKYIRLWGPLCTHLAFGFENMNGHAHAIKVTGDSLHLEIFASNELFVSP